MEWIAAVAIFLVVQRVLRFCGFPFGLAMVCSMATAAVLGLVARDLAVSALACDLGGGSPALVVLVIVQWLVIGWSLADRWRRGFTGLRPR